MRPVAVLSLLLFAAACDRSPAPAPPQTAPAEAAPEAPAAEPAAAPSSSATLRVDGREVTFASMLYWEMDAAGSMVPQLSFYEQEVSCDNRLTDEVPRFYASLLIAEEERVGEHKSPNWGYTGLPQFNPSSEDDTGYPPKYWGTVRITEISETRVRGTVDYESKGVTVKGAFDATVCSPM